MSFIKKEGGSGGQTFLALIKKEGLKRTHLECDFTKPLRTDQKKAWQIRQLGGLG